MTLVPVMDALYLWGEAGASPNHVIALEIFRPPSGAGPGLLDELHARMTDPTAVKPSFRRRPVRRWSTLGQFAWVEDDDLDMGLHVRRVTLPRPGRIRELLEHLGDWHAVPLARDRPLWAAHLVDGLADGRFALCTKMHHASFDGVTMGRHLLGGLSSDPADRQGSAPWIVPPRARGRDHRSARPAPSAPTDALGGAWRAGRAVVGSLPGLVGAGLEALRRDVPVPFEAPPTVLNGPVSSVRRFAGDAWPAERLRSVARRVGATTNDVGLAMCGGALRAYLAEREALPDESLVAMVPVSLQGTDPAGGATDGNSWAAALCGLATDTDDTRARLSRIHGSMARSKTLMTSLDPLVATALGAVTLAGGAPWGAFSLPRPSRPAFNLVISSIPATAEPLYLDGCELTDAYPLSLVVDGQALNITMIAYVDRLEFGLTGCPRAVPGLQRLLVHLEDALTDLEKATADLPDGGDDPC